MSRNNPSRPPAVNPLQQEAQSAGVQGQLSGAPIVNVIESNRQIALRENPAQVDKNYEWTTLIKPAIQIKKDDAIMVSNVFINQRGSSSDVLDFTSQDNNINLNSKTKTIFSFYATDDGTTGKRRQIDISGLTNYVFNQTNSYNSMKMERHENSILEIFATDYTDVNQVLWLDYYGNYEGQFDATISSICVARQDPWCDNRWFNSVGSDIQDYGDVNMGLCLHSALVQFKVYGRRWGDNTTRLTIERPIGDTSEEKNPANFVKEGDTFLLEVEPGHGLQAISAGFPIGQFLQCVNSDWTNKKIEMTELSTREAVPVFECLITAQAVSGGATVTVLNVTADVGTTDRYLIQTGNLGTPIMTPGTNYKIVSTIGDIVTVNHNFIANITGTENLVISPFPLNRDAVGNSDWTAFQFRLVNTGYSKIDNLDVDAEQSRGWNINNLVNDQDEMYQYQINRLAAGTGWDSNITDRQIPDKVGHIDGFTRFSTQKKAVYYNLRGHNPVTGFSTTPLTIVLVAGSAKANVLSSSGSAKINPWDTVPTYTTTELPYMAWITTERIALQQAINPMTGETFKNTEGVMYIDFRDSPSYLWRLNAESNIELYNYRTHTLDFTLAITKATAVDFFSAVTTDSMDVYGDPILYKNQFWSNNDVLTARTTSVIDGITTNFTFDLDDEAVWSTVDGLLGETSRFFNTNSRLMIQVIAPGQTKSALFCLDVGSSSVDSYPRENAFANKSTWVKTNRKNVAITNITRIAQSDVGDPTTTFPVGCEVKIYDPLYRCSPILRVYESAYDSYGFNNQYGTILSTSNPDYVKLNTSLFCRNNSATDGSFQPLGNPINVTRGHIGSHALWVDHLISHKIDLGKATNLSPSDVGSIITQAFQEPEDIRISHENRVGLATPRNNRLHGLMIPNTKSRGIYMNKFYCNAWDAYESLTEDFSQWSGRAAGSLMTGGFRFKMRYRDTPVYHDRTATAYNIRDGYYFDLYDDPNSPTLSAANSYYNGEYIVYIRSTHTGVNVVNNEQYRTATMTTTPTGNLAYSSVTIPLPVKNENYPITITSDPLWIAKAGHMVGASTATLNYNVDFSRFEFMLFHQPYINAVKSLGGGGGVVGGDQSAFLLLPNENIFQTAQRYKMSSVYTNSVWGRFSGINVENWCSPLKTYDNYQDFYNASLPDILDVSQLDPDGVRFMNKIGYTTESLVSTRGWDGGYNLLDTNKKVLHFYQPLGTTTNNVDISNSFIPSNEAPTNYQRPNQAPGGTNPITVPESFQQGSYGGLGLGWGVIPAAGGSDEYDIFGSIDNNHMGGNLPPTTGEPLIFNDAIAGQKYNVEPDFNPDCRIFMGYTIDANTSSIMAQLLPEKNNSPYYLLLCPEIAGGNNFYSTRANGSVSPNVCSIISRLNAEQDFVFSYQSPITFYAKQDIILSSITCKVLMPDYSAPSNLSANSSVIFQVVRESPQPPYIQPTMSQIQADGYNQLAIAENTMRHLSSQESGAQSIRNGVLQISGLLADAGLHPYAASGASIMTRIQQVAAQNGLYNMTPTQRRTFMATPQGAEILGLLNNVGTMAAAGRAPPLAVPQPSDDPLTAVLNIPTETLTPDDPESTLVTPPRQTQPAGADVEDFFAGVGTPQPSQTTPQQLGAAAVARAGYTPEDVASMERFQAGMRSQERVGDIRQQIQQANIVSPSQKQPDDSGVGTGTATMRGSREGTASPPPYPAGRLSDIAERQNLIEAMEAAGAPLPSDAAALPIAGAHHHQTAHENLAAILADDDIPAVRGGGAPPPVQEQPEPAAVAYDPGFATIRGRRMVDETNRPFTEPDLQTRQLDTREGQGNTRYYRATRIPEGGYGTAETATGTPTPDPAVYGFPGTLRSGILNRVYGTRSVYASDSPEAAHRFILEGLGPRARESNLREYDIHEIDATGLNVTPIVDNPDATTITERFASDYSPDLLNPEVATAIRERSRAYAEPNVAGRPGMVQLNREHLLEGPITPDRIRHVARYDYSEFGDDPSEHRDYGSVRNAAQRHREALERQKHAVDIRATELNNPTN